MAGSEFDFFDESNTGSGGNSGNIDPVLILIKVIRNWPIIVLSCVMGLLVVLIYHRYTTERYSLRGSIMIPEENPNIATGFFREFIGGGFTPNFLNELEVLRSEDVTAAAIDSLDFNIEYYSKGRIKTIEEYKTLPFLIIPNENHAQVYNREFLISFYENNDFRLTFADDEEHSKSPLYKPNSMIQTESYSFTVFFERSVSLNGKSYTFKFREREDLVREWNSRLNVSFLREFTTIAVIRLNHSEPKKGANFINTLMEVYRSQELKRKNDLADKTISYINRELKVLDDTLAIYESMLDRVKVEERTLNLENVGDPILNRLTALERRKGELEGSIRSLEQNLLFLQDSTKWQDAFPPIMVSENQLLTKSFERLQELVLDRAKLSNNLAPFNPIIKERTNEINGLVSSIKTNASLQIEEYKEELQVIERDIKSSEKEFSNYPEKQRQLSDIQRIYNVYVGMFQFLQQKRAEAGIAKASNEANAQVVDKATPNVKAIFPNKPFNYVVGAGVGLLLPLMFFVLREVLNDKVEFRKQIEKLTSIPVIGMIGHNKYEGNLAVLKHPKSIMSESFRAIRSNMAFFGRDRKIQTVLVTSNASGEGKSFCSLNLASMLAVSGKKTVLIGLDLRKPKLYDDFGLTNDFGVSNYLAGFVDRDKIIQKTAYENLDLIAAGPVPPNPAELLISDEMKELIQYLKDHYEQVIIDTPPVGIVADTFNLTHLADLNIFVVRQNYTVKQVFPFLNDITKKGIVKNATLLLNDFKVNRGYGYGYGYG
ncbi:GumC family protein, partial [Roseivirga sp. UBA838]